MPETIALSPAAVAVLRFEIKGYRARDPERRLAAYHELAAAGIMEPVPGSELEYRFTDDGFTRRDEILREAEIGIERALCPVPDLINLSESAAHLLRRRLSGEPVEVSDENRPLYHELAAVGLVEPVHTFARGRDSHYRLTLGAMERKAEFLSDASLAPSR